MGLGWVGLGSLSRAKGETAVFLSVCLSGSESDHLPAIGAMTDGFLNSGSNNPHPHPIMLRFRPIAPKPFNGVSVPLPSLAESRSKRKYVARRRNPPRGRIRRRASPKPLVLKQPLLLPGKVVEPSPRTKAGDGSKDAGAGSSQLVKSFSFSREGYVNFPASPRVTTPGSPLLPDLNEVVSGTPPPDPWGEETPLSRPRRVLETWLIVESVAADATCIQRVGLQQEEEVGGKKMTDEERVRRLVRDTCPGFVTDEENLIRWVNGACERMVRERLSTAGGGVAAVWVVTREELPYGCPAFTCRVRIVYTWQDEGRPMWWPGGRGVSVALCDAWRLESGGFAWRLDVEAALSLAPAKGS